MASVALCADEQSIRYPETLGLAAENLRVQYWLRIFTDAEKIRCYLRSERSAEEVWVISGDGAAPINIAATLKKDHPEKRVFLVSFKDADRLQERAIAAGLDGLLDETALVKRYQHEKALASGEIFAMRDAGGAAASVAGALGERSHRQRSPRLSMGNEVPCLEPCRDAADACGEVSPALSSDRNPSDSMAVSSLSSQTVPSYPYSAAALSRDYAAEAYDFCEDWELEGSTSDGAVAQDRQIQKRPSQLARTDAQRKCVLVPVLSGSGGSGKSTIALLSAFIAQGRGLRTLLLDFDFQFGAVARMVTAANVPSVDDVLASPSSVQRLQPEGALPAVVAAPRHLERAEILVERAAELIDLLEPHFDVIVVDTGAAWAEQHAVLLERDAKPLFVIDQRMSSLHACQHALDFCARCGIATGPFQFLVNRVGKGAVLSALDVSCALKGVAVAELRDGGKEVEECLSAGIAFELLQSRNPLCVSLEKLLDALLPAEVAEPVAASTLLASGKARRKHRFGRRRQKECLC